MNHRKLDWMPEHDERSRRFPMRSVLDQEGRPHVQTKYWNCPVVLDQGQEGACVGFSFAARLAAEMLLVPGITDEVARNIFNKAKTLDQWAGTSYDWTSVLAGAKAVKRLFPEYVKAYRWTFGLMDVLHTLSHYSPVVLGIPWHRSMYETTPEGQIKVEGPVSGGHAILAVGIDAEKKTVTLRNSWGIYYGIKGDGWITWDDLEKLLKGDAEGCVLIQKGAA